MAQIILHRNCLRSPKLKLKALLQASGTEHATSWNKSSGPIDVADTTASDIDVKPFSEMPGPVSLPFIGTLYKYTPLGDYSFTRPHLTDMKRFEKYGNIVHEQIFPGMSSVHLYDPDDIATMFRAEGKYPVRMHLEGFKKYRIDRNLSVGLANLNGEPWQAFRSQVQQKMMRPTSATVYIPAQDPVAEDFVNRMARIRNENGEIDNYLQELYKWAMECVVCFDSRLGTLPDDLAEDSEANQFIAAVNRAFEGLHWTTFLWKIYEKRPHMKTVKNLYEDLDTIWEIASRHINEAVLRAANEEPTLVPRDESLLLALLSKENLKQDDAMTLVGDLFMAGVDTTAHTMAFTLYNLAMNGESQRSLQEEIDSLAPPGTEITNKVLNEMKYLKAVTKETSRLTPTTGGTMRILDHDVVLSGYNVPAGTNLFCGNSVISRREEYFDKPDEFIPERWLRKGEQKNSSPHGFASLPFGHGPRMCIGRRFAEQEIWLGLIKILQRFNVEYKYEPIGSVTRLVNMPDKPLKFSFVDRT